VRRLLGPAAGALLVALALRIVGVDDRVVDESGATHRGRLVDVPPGTAVADGVRGATRPVEEGDVVLRTARGDRAFTPARIRSVRAGLLSAFRPLAARPWIALLALALHLGAIVAVHLRWAVLLRAAGVSVTLPTVLRLGWIGQFAASVLPGGFATGDVVKALYVAGRNGDRRAHSVTTVVFDRLLGLLVLCSIALPGALFAPGSTRVGGTRALLALLLGGGLLLLALLLLPRLRAATGIARLLPRRFAAFAQEAGEAFALYAKRPRAVAAAALVAVLSQSLVLLALFLYGRALGVTMSLFAVLAALPVAQMVSAVPGLPGGFGVGDLAFVALLPDAGVPAGTALALSFTYKTVHLVVALPAAFFTGTRRDRNPSGGRPSA
jgi:uncharacterized protein (TIRG00374 family)